MRHRRTVLHAGLLSASALGVGCVSVPPEAGFPQVQQTVAERTGQRVHWRRGGEEDAAVDAELRAMLARPMSPDDAVQVALLNNRSLQATYEDLMVAQADLVQAGLLRNPVFDAEVLLESGRSAGLELSVAQDFLQVFQIPLRKRVAGAGFEAAKLDVTAAVLDRARAARRDAVELIAAGQRVELRRTVLDAAGAGYYLARRLHEAGNTTDLALLMERARYEQARLDLADAEAAFVQRRERMNVTLGLWGPAAEAWSMIDRLPDPPAGDTPGNDTPGNDTPGSDSTTGDDLAADGLLARALENSPALAAARYRLEALGDRLGLERTQGWLPGFEAGVKGERDLGSDDWVAGPVFTLPIPLFDQGQAGVARAVAEVRRARADYYAQAVEVRAAVRAAYADLQAAEARVRYHRQVMLPLREQVVHETLLQYNAMQVGVFELLQARQMQVEAGLGYIEALSSYWLNHATLTSIVDGGSPDFLTPDSSPSSPPTMTDGNTH